jgi:deoxyribodipyrimidine photo-lyase
MKTRVQLVWFRRDLRLHDQAALYHALQSGEPVLPVFIFDRQILDKLPNPQDARVSFIHDTIQKIHNQLAAWNSTIETFYGTPIDAFKHWAGKYEITAIYTNSDYENYARQRDSEIGNWAQNNGIAFNEYKDQVIFEKSEVVKDDGKPYTVFTPYSKRWKASLQNKNLQSLPVEKYKSNFLKTNPAPLISLEEMNFIYTKPQVNDGSVPDEIIKHYQQQRDLPGISGTSRLGIHLRFGTISIRE